MNSYEFKPPKDRQTDTGDSGEAPQHFPIENIFSTMISFFYFKPPHIDRQTYSSNRHRTHTHTETGFYNIDCEISVKWPLFWILWKNKNGHYFEFYEEKNCFKSYFKYITSTVTANTRPVSPESNEHFIDISLLSQDMNFWNFQSRPKQPKFF